MTYLFGHSSPETAYVGNDYPYSFKLRTQIRYWVESVAKKGDRMCSQTLNPKSGKWNTPKCSTYSPVIFMYLDEKNHVQRTGHSIYDSREKWAAFISEVGGVAAG